jgi:hypothetical protein
VCDLWGSSERHGDPFAHALSGFAVIHAESMPRRQREDGIVLIPTGRIRIARYCAMLCSYAMAAACKRRVFGGVRVDQRALKARNV